MIIVDGKLVNPDTGEVIIPSYTVTPFAGKTSAEENKLLKATAFSPYDCKEPAELTAFMKANADMRGVRIANHLINWFNAAQGLKVLNGGKSDMTQTQFKILSKLIPLLSYKNIILCDRAQVAKTLGTDRKNLNRALETVSVWVVNKPNVKKGFIKLIINPSLAYKGHSETLQGAITTFYKLARAALWPDLTLPFPGTLREYKEHVFSDEMQGYLNGLNAKLAKKSKADIGSTLDAFDLEWLESIKAVTLAKAA